MNRLQKHPSPPLWLLAAVHLVLFAAGLGGSAALAHGAVFPSPFDAGAASAYFGAHADAVRVAGFFLAGSAVPLGLFAATAASRLTFFGAEVAGVTIALFGGIAASLMLLSSGLCMWGLGQLGAEAVPQAVRALHLLAFATGGPGFSMMFGLLVLGVSLAGVLAVSGSRRLPRWLLWFGLVLGVVAELSSLSLLSNTAAFLLPLVRFPGFVWLIAVGVTMPTARVPRKPEA